MPLSRLYHRISTEDTASRAELDLRSWTGDGVVDLVLETEWSVEWRAMSRGTDIYRFIRGLAVEQKWADLRDPYGGETSRKAVDHLIDAHILGPTRRHTIEAFSPPAWRAVEIAVARWDLVYEEMVAARAGVVTDLNCFLDHLQVGGAWGELEAIYKQ